jgi:hypothetical protein
MKDSVICGTCFQEFGSKDEKGITTNESHSITGT